MYVLFQFHTIPSLLFDLIIEQNKINDHHKELLRLSEEVKYNIHFLFLDHNLYQNYCGYGIISYVDTCEGPYVQRYESRIMNEFKCVCIIEEEYQQYFSVVRTYMQTVYIHNTKSLILFYKNILGMCIICTQRYVLYVCTSSTLHFLVKGNESSFKKIFL